MEPSSSKGLEFCDWEWLSMFYQSAEEVGEMVVDDFATIKRRMIDKNEDKLKKNCNSNSWVVKNIAKNFVQSISKSVENLEDLKKDIIKGLKMRYPNLEGDGLSENSVENSVSSTAKSPDNLDSGDIRNVAEERERGDEKMEPRIVNKVIKQLSGIDKSNVSNSQPKRTRSVIQSRTTLLGSLNGNGETVVINSESDKESEGGLKRNQNQNNHKQTNETQSRIPPVGRAQKENVIIDSESRNENDIGLERKKNLSDEVSSPPGSPFKSTVPVSVDSSTLPVNETENPEVLIDSNQIIPASPMSSQEMEIPIQVHDDKDEDPAWDSTVPSEGAKDNALSDLEEDEDENMLTSKQINVSVSENPDDQKPSSSTAKSNSTVELNRRTLDRKSIRAKKLVLMLESSDDDDFKPTPRRKPIKSSKVKNKENRDLSKKKDKTTSSSHFNKHVTSSDETDIEEGPEKAKEVTKSRKGKKKVDPDYWKNHDFEDDEKLQNPDKAKVVLKKLSKAMEEELESYGFLRIAALSESEMAYKRITAALRNFDKFDPLVKTDESDQNHSSKNRNRDLKSRKCTGERKYGLDAIIGSEDNESSDNSGRNTELIAPRIATDIFSNSDSSACDIFGFSGTDDETAKRNVLADSEEELTENKIKKGKKENTEKCNKDSKEKKKNYYVPPVCYLTGSDDDGKKREWKQSKPKEAVQSRKFSEDDSSDEFITPRKRILGRTKVSSQTEDTSDGSSDEGETSESSSRMKTTRRGKRQRSSSSEEETRKMKKRRRIQVVDSDDSDGNKKRNDLDSDIQEVEIEKPESLSPSKGRRRIRKVMSKKELELSTREAAKEEENRKRRILEKQKMVIFNSQSDVPESDVIESLVLDFDSESEETLVAADPSVVRKLKPHQANGIKFIYDCTVESTKQIQKGNAGGGCIIAHCMGLGKTLTTIAFVHAALTHEVLNFKTVLIICPLNTVTNWYSEFRCWLRHVPVRVNVHKLWNQRNYKDRATALADFKSQGGVGIIHYDLFRRLADLSREKKIDEELKEQIRENLLDPGADIVVCDEGHVLKNDKSKLSIAVNKIKTKRRIVLTGTPLQNNLAEYHTMMSFVKPNLLGTIKEFQNRFINPIKNGQHADSLDYDVRLMKRRAHVLHKLLDGCVQRLDYNVLIPYLPPKFEYVVMVKMTPKQVELYKHYLENLKSRTTVIDRHRTILKNYAYLLKIWTHPIVLTKIVGKKRDCGDAVAEGSEGSMKDFVVDGNESSSGSSDSDCNIGEQNKKLKKKKADENVEPAVVPDVNVDAEPQELPPDWYLKFFESKEDMVDPLLGGKFDVLMEILKICESIGDKLLVFSQYLSSLDLIEEFLQNWDNESSENKKSPISSPADLGSSNGRWRKNIEYFRIDGSTKSDVRQDQCDKFNKKPRAKVFLISTKAGGLGINLVGANRVVIFDASWNPSNDMQSIYRVYRFGQNKPCYIYRLLAEGTMEEKIYNRQVVKLSLSGRVVDEHQIERHFKFEDTSSLYLYEDPDEKVDRPIPPVPKDRLLADLLISHNDRITTYLEHDSLLVNRVDEGLTDEERKSAWEEYNYEKEHRPGPQTQENNDGSTFNKIWNILQQRNPAMPPAILKLTTDTILAQINELQVNLNYCNLHTLTPNEEQSRKATINGLRNSISHALGNNSANPTVLSPSHAHNVPRMQMQTEVARYSSSNSVTQSIRSVAQNEPEA